MSKETCRSSLKIEQNKFSGGKWLNTKQAAEYLGTTDGGVRNRVYRGQLAVYKPFGKLGLSYFKKSELDRLIETSKS